LNWTLLQNSLLVSSLTTLLASVFGLASALWLAGLEPRWRNCFLALALIALALPPFLVTNSWMHFLGAAGVWRSWLHLDVLSLGGTVWILSLMLWPVTLLIVLSAWRRLEPAQLESDTAVTGWNLLRGLLLPLAGTALAQAAVLTFVLALNNFAVPVLLQVKVFTEEIWIRFNTELSYKGALRLSWPLIIGPLLLLFWLSRKAVPWPHLEAPVSAKLFRQQLGPAWFRFAGALTLLVCALSVAMPLYQILSVKRTWTELGSAIAAGQNAIWTSFWLSAVAAGLVMVIATVGSMWKKREILLNAQGNEQPLTPALSPYEGERESTSLVSEQSSAIGHFELRSDTTTTSDQELSQLSNQTDVSPLPFIRGKGQGEGSCQNATKSLALAFARGFKNLRIQSLLAGLLWLPFLLPGVLLGIALIYIFNRPWSALFYQSAGIVILAYVIRYLAPGWMAAFHATESLDPDLLDAARLEGATRWQIFRHVAWPQTRHRLLAAWYILFLLCLWDVESMILIVPPGGETLSLRIFNLLHYGYNAQVNALCLTLLVLALLPLLASGVWHALRPRRFSVSRLGLLTVALAVCLTLACTPSGNSKITAIESRLFSGVEIIGTRGVGIGQLNKPRSVAVDAKDNLYVVDMTGRVQKFSPSGVFQLFWQMPQTDLGKPKGMCRDREGNIVVVEPHYQRINYFSTEGKLLGQWGVKGTNAGQLIMPRAVAINSHHETFLSEYSVVERVQKFAFEASDVQSNHFTATPHLEAVFGHAGTEPGEFNRPEGLCVDREDRLYVADSCNHRIQIFNSDGKLLRSHGKAGKAPGELSYPYDICVDGAGRQYVCEFGNSRIQIFDANDNPIEIIGGPGAEPGHFSNPWGVALDSAGNLYVADSQNHRVQKLLRKPQVITQR
jgi:ABC-type Fe3+ transport system permease subunit/DNA-binding beta-propeller fold protein YncE